MLDKPPFAWYADGMATPGQLVATLAEVLGISAGTVALFDRELAASGLRAKHGRGRSAAKVSASDAANLFVAVAAAPLSGTSIRFAARTCTDYCSLPIRQQGSWNPSNFRKFGLPALSDLPDGHSLGEALRALIESVARGQAFHIPVRGEPPITDADDLFGIRFEGPQLWAEILADGSVGRGRTSQMARYVYSPAEAISRLTGDLRQSRSVTYATVRALGSLLAQWDRPS